MFCQSESAASSIRIFLFFHSFRPTTMPKLTSTIAPIKPQKIPMSSGKSSSCCANIAGSVILVIITSSPSVSVSRKLTLEDEGRTSAVSSDDIPAIDGGGRLGVVEFSTIYAGTFDVVTGRGVVDVAAGGGVNEGEGGNDDSVMEEDGFTLDTNGFILDGGGT